MAEAKVKYKYEEVGDGGAFLNDEKTSETHPLYKGNLTFEKDIPSGQKLQVAMWLNEAQKDGKKLKKGDKYWGLKVSIATALEESPTEAPF